MKPLSLLPLAALFAIPLASAREYPIGEPQQCAGMEVGAVYLQPIEMDPPGMMRPAAESDVHMEADISALENNRHGFQEGSFVPYLSISYRLQQRVGSDRPSRATSTPWSPVTVRTTATTSSWTVPVSTN